MKEFVIRENDADQRVDKFILKAFPELQKSVMYKAVRTKNIKINGKRCEISTRLQAGDILRIYINDELLGNEKKSDPHKFMNAENISDDDIIYEDGNIILINKKPGIIIHSDNNISADTLVDRLKKYLYLKNEYNPENENVFSPAVCNRLDRNTAGIVIAAKNSASLREVNRKIRDGELKKQYLCLLASMPSVNEAVLTAYHKKDENTNKVIISDEEEDGSRKIITGYKVLEKRSDGILTEITLFTGRSHQIRAHMAHIGCPVMGDSKYGIKSINEKHHFKYQALCAYKIKFEPSAVENCLSYLDEMEFMTEDIWFLKKHRFI